MTELNFPANPSDGDSYLSYKYDLATDAWYWYGTANISEVSNVDTSTLSDRDVFEYDQPSGKWISSNKQPVPVGIIIPFAGDVVPEGYLLCDGSTKLTSEYQVLNSVIGNTYSSGDEPVGHFRLPNLSGRASVGIDQSQTEFYPLGKTGGSKTHVLTVGEMPSHTHIQNAHTHSQNAHNHSQDSHSHSVGTPFNVAGSPWGLGYFGSFRGRVGVTGGWGLGTDGRTPGIQNTTATNQNTTAINLPTGGSGPHNNLQPYIAMNYIIKC